MTDFRIETQVQEIPLEGIAVAWGEWQKGGPSDTLYTLELGPCIGVAIYDRATKIGHMAHVYAGKDRQDKALDPLIDSVQANATDASNMVGWVVGGMVGWMIGGRIWERSRWLTPERRLRRRAVRKLGALGLEQGNLSVQWNNERQQVDMSLDCATGDFRVASSNTERSRYFT